MKIVTVVGARPQFIKAAAVSRVIRNDYVGQIDEVLVHTGQHYDDNMSKVFFEELDIPHPKYNLEISGGQHGAMTGRMLEGVENVLLQEKPDWLLIYGDTNSTLAGALAAAKLHIPVAHVEAGLRSFNMRMPEEVNRILADRVSSLLFCPTETAVNNLKSEGVCQGVHNVGDVMYDVALFYRDRARQNSKALQNLGVTTGGFALATCHRAENTDDPRRLMSILIALSEISPRLPVVLPLHPRTRKLVADYGLVHLLAKLIITEPLPFLDMVALEQASRLILTDSGGVQKEAFFYGVPCITMRDETEWVETVSLGWNQLVGASSDSIISAVNEIIQSPPSEAGEKPYGIGNAAGDILALLN
ncbi:UDP-N-acetylglucosamine 2-epimerase (non-hydrolyzing) [Dechloromonas sp. XY25]|uniref:UDP-N-acetylglucosamine 2-epimerase (Non-hydrolyzing) n=1 Tax=Dechloromonas hankyongensis TaxID=2908002 RepID=A0ABS9JZC5_9RHOO|nr:UDP-N-acetylglucosamine 2-epimerase (non-hydrolyzing) [Dechloromonas hankyongensis]MCG2576255.1 UDP-N-acetylglucosamine 2-epimerase (non-hydrolyzing) [Dechloromonas hankyongensis]